MGLVKWALELAEAGRLPTTLVRQGTRGLIWKRLSEIRGGTLSPKVWDEESFVQMLKSSPIALEVEKANEQHYELPASFFEKVLGPYLKYSSGYWPEGIQSLGESEKVMLDLVCERAQLFDGMELLDLGCGWGSLSLYVAEKYPHSKVTAVSNSRFQREFILKQAEQRGLKNIQVITADMNQLELAQLYDRVVSVEMFEHMRNYERLLNKISQWMKPSAKLFVHIFCHRDRSYLFETEGETNWMGQYFFTGGMMPSFQLLERFQEDLKLEERWKVNGVHYAKTSRAWLNQLDRQREEVLKIFDETYGRGMSQTWFHRWRLFFIACEELFGFRGGNEWLVGHYLFHKP